MAPTTLASAERALDGLRSLAEQAVGPVQPFVPGPKLTSLGGWYVAEDGSVLVLVVEPGRGPDDVVKAVAYAVAWQRDRRLVLLVPADASGSVVARLSHLSTPVAVWAIADDQTLSRVAIPSPDRVLSDARGRRLRREESHDLGARGAWMTEVIDTADGHWALEPAHRGSYLSWHCAGRQVLKVMRQGGGVLVEAGVQYTKPRPGLDPFREVLTGPPTKVQRARIEAAVAVAVRERVTGRDATHVEHQLQAALAASRLSGLEMARFEREYPAWRGDGASGFIDFLGLDTAGRLHVIETKIGSDPMLVFQAVDYAVWVRAHAAAIRDGLGWPTGDDTCVHVDLVVAPKVSRGQTKPAIGPYTAGQLQALTPDLPWRIHLVEDARAEVPRVDSLPPRTLPDPDTGMIAAPITDHSNDVRDLVEHRLT